MYEIKYRKAEEMKDSGVEWIGNVPKNWQIVRNKNLFFKSKRIAGKNAQNYRVLSLTLNGVIYRDIESNMGKMPKDWNQYQIVDRDDLLMCLFDIDVTPRTVGYVNKAGIVSPAYSNYKKYNNSIDMKFFYYWYLNLDMRKMLLHLSKNLRNSISSTEFDKLNTLLPSTMEQQKIANFLDVKTTQFDSIISKKEKLIEKLEETKKSLISEVVTGKVKIVDGQLVKRQLEEMKDSGVEWLGMIPKEWTHIRINDVASVIDPQPDHRAPKLSEDVGYPYVGIRDINEDGTINYSTCRKVELQAVIKQERSFKLENQDIVFCRVATLGYPRFIINNERIALSATLCIIKAKKINSEFLKFLLQSNIIEHQMDLFSTGSTRKSLGMEVIRKFHILKASQEEQEVIVQYLNNGTRSIDSIIFSTKLQIKKLKQAKQSLISESVTGKIDLRDWEIIEEGEVK